MSHIFYEVEELNQVEKLRIRLQNVMTPKMSEDTTLFVRFLRARNGDLDKAEEMLRKHIEWRKKHDVDSIMSHCAPEALEKYFGASIIGLSRAGFPIIYADLGRIDARGLLLSIKPYDATKQVMKILETVLNIAKEQTKKLNKDIHQVIVLINVEDFTLSLATNKTMLEVILHLISMYEANYPEILSRCYIINGLWCSQIAWRFIKPFIIGDTLKKIEMYGKEDWKDEILKEIDPDELPRFLGGNKTDPDGNPMCKTFIKHSGPVPEKYHTLNNKNDFASRPDVKKLKVNRHSKESIELNVPKSESIIKWEFQIKDLDIDIALFYQNDQNSNLPPVEILPKQRYTTSVCPEAGFYQCDKPGMYYLEFDNSYSWIYSKEIYIITRIVTPQN